MKGVRNTVPPVVPLEAGASADNPPCPACGEPLFGWALLRPDKTPVRRCEQCGLGLVGGPTSREEAIAALDEAAGAGGRLPNRTSLQAWIGGSGWSALHHRGRFLFTPASIELLGRSAGRPSTDVVAMWQTLVNSFTFGHNIALSHMSRADAVEAGEPWQRRLDWVITYAAAIPVMLFAVIFELPAALFGRGGRLQLRQTD